MARKAVTTRHWKICATGWHEEAEPKSEDERLTNATSQRMRSTSAMMAKSFGEKSRTCATFS